MKFSAFLELIIGIVVVIGAITEWSFFGSYAEQFPMRKNKTFRIMAGILGALIALLGLFLLLK